MRAEEDGGEQRPRSREVGRRGLGAAGADRVPAVEVAGPQLGDVGGRGQQRTARERAAAEQSAAGDERDEQQHGEEHRAGLAGDPLEPGELLDLQEVGVVAAGPGLDGAVPSAPADASASERPPKLPATCSTVARDGRAGRREQRPQLACRTDGLAAPAARGEDPSGPQQRAAEAA